MINFKSNLFTLVNHLHNSIHIYSYLIKSWDWALQGKTLVPTLNYLSKFVKRKTNQRWDPSIMGIVDALQAVAAKYVFIIFIVAYAN